MVQFALKSKYWLNILGLSERTQVQPDRLKLWIRSLMMERQSFAFRRIEWDKPVTLPQTLICYR